MSTGFLDATASAGSGLDHYKLKPGSNKFRLFGGIVQRYVYWAKSHDGNKDLSIECLAFDRKQGRFLNKEEDVFKKFFPYKLDQNGEPMLDKNGNKVEPRCSWAYAILCLDLDEGTPTSPVVKIFYLKKKMFAAIQEIAKKRLGDPTDPEKGWDVTVERKSTGPLPINVEYTVDAFECSDGKRPLTEEELEAIEETPSIDELLPRQTAEEQEAFIRKYILGEGQDEDVEEGVDQEAVEDI